MKELPPGQKASERFPRFGLPQYATRFPKEIDQIKLLIGGHIESFAISDGLQNLPRTNQTSDFHCVTTWSKLNLNWSGFKFRDFYNTLILPKLNFAPSFVILKSQDGYKTSLPLEDLMQDDVLLADRLDDAPLTLEHGAPVRIVAPKHYGYKNVKHLNRIDFYRDKQVLKRGVWKFMDHPRARVAKEERAIGGPQLFFRYLYSIGIDSTIRDFEKATEEYRAENPEVLS